jgi:hypothetical protein
VHRAFPGDWIYSRLWLRSYTREGGNGLGPTWLQGFLNQCTALPACFASTMDLQRAYANALESIKDHFRKLRDVIRYKIKEENM